MDFNARPMNRLAPLQVAVASLCLLIGSAAAAQTLQDVAASIDAGDFEGALVTFEEVDAAQDIAVDTYRNVASALFRAGGNAQAVAVLEVGIGEYPDASRFLFLIGFIHVDSGDCATAIPAFERFIAEAPNDPDGFFQMGVCYAELGRPDDARVSLLRYLELETRDDQDDQLTTANTLLEDLGADEVIDASVNGATDEPEPSSRVEQPEEAPLTSAMSFATYEEAMGAASAFVAERSWAQAAEAFAAAALVDANNVEAWYKLGVTRAISGDALGARDAFRRTRQLDPDVPGIDDLVRGAEARVEYEARTAIDPPGYFVESDVRQASRREAFASQNWLLGIRAELGVPLEVAWTAAIDRALLEGRVEDARTISVLAIGESPGEWDRYLRAADVHRISGDITGARYFLRLYLDFGGDVVAAAPIRTAIELLGEPSSP